MNYRRFLIRLFTFMGGTYFFLEFVLPEQIGSVRIDSFHDQITNGFIAVGSMALGLGLINLFMIHGSKIIFKRRGWINSMALLGGLLLMIAVTIADWRATSTLAERTAAFYMLRDFAIKIADEAERPGGRPAFERQQKLVEALQPMLTDLERSLEQPLDGEPADEADAKKLENFRGQLAELAAGARHIVQRLDPKEQNVAALAALNRELAPHLGKIGSTWKEYLSVQYQFSTTRRMYRLLFEGLFVALGSAMFALLGFYIAAAAYRAFKVRSAESALMMAAAVIVMLGQIPFGVWIWSRFPAVRLWLLQVPNAAAFRAIGIGAAVAGLLMAFRMWFSLESESFTEES